jgi:hypothetical protein
MSKIYSDARELWKDVDGLIDAWCERRCLAALALILPAARAINGLRDSWGEFLEALSTLLATRDVLTPDEIEIVRDIKREVERLVYRS